MLRNAAVTLLPNLADQLLEFLLCQLAFCQFPPGDKVGGVMISREALFIGKKSNILHIIDPFSMPNKRGKTVLVKLRNFHLRGRLRGPATHSFNAFWGNPKEKDIEIEKLELNSPWLILAPFSRLKNASNF